MWIATRNMIYPRTLSKLLAAGMTEADALARVTVHPAEFLGLSGEVGTLSPGACADLAVLRFNQDALPLQDVKGLERAWGVLGADSHCTGGGDCPHRGDCLTRPQISS